MEKRMEGKIDKSQRQKRHDIWSRHLSVFSRPWNSLSISTCIYFHHCQTWKWIPIFPYSFFFRWRVFYEGSICEHTWKAATRQGSFSSFCVRYLAHQSLTLKKKLRKWKKWCAILKRNQNCDANVDFAISSVRNELFLLNGWSFTFFPGESL